jgi:hypothetical protein
MPAEVIHRSNIGGCKKSAPADRRKPAIAK